MEVLPAHEEGLVDLDPVEALRHPETDVEGARLVLNGAQGAEVIGNGVIFEALIELLGQHDLGRPEAMLVRILREPDLEALDRLGLDVGLRAGLGIEDDNIETASGKAVNLLLETVDAATLPAAGVEAELMDHGRHRPLDGNDTGLVLDRFSADVALKQARLGSVGETERDNVTAVHWVVKKPGGEDDAVLPVPALPVGGFGILVGEEALRKDGMNVPNAVMSQRVLGAFLETIETLAVDGAQL
jgi:hypothetical protein